MRIITLALCIFTILDLTAQVSSSKDERKLEENNWVEILKNTSTEKRKLVLIRDRLTKLVESKKRKSNEIKTEVVVVRGSKIMNDRIEFGNILFSIKNHDNYFNLADSADSLDQILPLLTNRNIKDIMILDKKYLDASYQDIELNGWVILVTENDKIIKLVSKN